MRAAGNVILKVDTSTTSTPSFVDLEKVQLGLTMGGSTDTFSMDSLDNVSGFKLVAPGDSDYEISGSYIIAAEASAPGQAALQNALRSADKTIKVQWAEVKGKGLKQYTALCVVTAGVMTANDPLTRSFTLKPAEPPTETTQA